jgi:hypothetical protein
MRLLIALSAAAAVALGLLAGPASAATTPTPTHSFARTVKVTGQDRKGHAFTGRYTIDRFARSGDRLYAVGTMRGTLGQRHVVKRDVRTRVVRNTGGIALGQAAATCTILDLTIRPIDLNLLGLVVHLDRVHLLVTGETGSGNLLGNLLCGLTGILDPPALGTGQLTQLLNGLLGFLQPTGL